MKRVVESAAKRAVVRRRSFTREFKRLVVKESLAPGTSVSGIALKHRLNANMLFTWRRRYLRELADAQSVNLLPVRIEASGTAVSTERPTEQSARTPASLGCIEIEAFGACIRIKGVVDAAALRSVLDALSQR